MGKGYKFLIFISFAIGTISGSESVKLNTSLSQSQFTVGDKINLTISANVDKAAQLIAPTEESFGKITVKEWNLQKAEKQNYDSIWVQYVITSYTPENCTIPSLQFILKTTDKEDTLFTNSIPLQVLSVINSSDSSVDIKLLRSQQITGKAPLWWFWLIISVTIILALIFGIRYLSKLIRKKVQLPPPKPPYEEAIEALGILHGKRYLQQGLIKEYVFELTEIFKRYIARRFEINAEEYTTEELVAWLGVSGLEFKIRNPLEWFFPTTDLVKFAKFIPDNETVERFSKVVTDFLEITRPQLTENKNAEEPVESKRFDSEPVSASIAPKKEMTSETGERR